MGGLRTRVRLIDAKGCSRIHLLHSHHRHGLRLIGPLRSSAAKRHNVGALGPVSPARSPNFTFHYKHILAFASRKVFYRGQG